MTSFYDNEDKLTFDEADVIVERFIRKYEDRMNRVTSKEVAKKCDVEPSRHNVIRINEALSERLEVSRPAGTRATQFKIE